MQKPNTYLFGVKGTIGTAPQNVATTKYSVGTSFHNKHGDLYMRVTVKSDKAFDLYIFGQDTDAAFSSTDAGVADGALLEKFTGCAANGGVTTGIDGQNFNVIIAACKYVLPVVYTATGATAAVSITYHTFNS
jgi:hypothetical protein